MRSYSNADDIFLKIEICDVLEEAHQELSEAFCVPGLEPDGRLQNAAIQRCMYSEYIFMGVEGILQNIKTKTKI